MNLFLSYAHVDKPQIETIQRSLIKAKHQPWIDSIEIVPGSHFPREIANAIAGCDVFIYFMTPEAIISKWCQDELGIALSLHKEILPILLQAKTQIPEALSHHEYADFTNGFNKKALNSLLLGLAVAEQRIVKTSEDLRKIKEEGLEAMRDLLAKFIPNFDEKFPKNIQVKLLTEIRDEHLFKLNPARALIFGRTSAGKSTTINSLLEYPIFPTDGRLSCTKSLASGEHKGGLIIYDSPGVGDEYSVENITRLALSLNQLDKKPIKTLWLIDITSSKNEGPSDYRSVSYDEYKSQVTEDYYTQNKENIAVKEFDSTEFYAWASKNLDFFIFVMNSNPGGALTVREEELIRDLYQTKGPNLQLFKVLNTFPGHYAENESDLPDDVLLRLNQSKERLQGLPNSNVWYIVDAKSGKGFDKLIHSLIESLPPDTLRSLEHVLQEKYIHHFQKKLLYHYYDFVVHIASLLAVFPADYTDDTRDLLRYAFQSLITIAEFLFAEQAKNVPPSFLDGLVQKLKQSKQRDLTETHWIEGKKTVKKEVKDTEGLNGIWGAFGDIFGVDMYTKKIIEEDKPDWYSFTRKIGEYSDISGVEGIQITLSLGKVIKAWYVGHVEYPMKDADGNLLGSYKGKVSSEDAIVSGLREALEKIQREIEPSLHDIKPSLEYLIGKLNRDSTQVTRLGVAEQIYSLVRPLVI